MEFYDGDGTPMILATVYKRDTHRGRKQLKNLHFPTGQWKDSRLSALCIPERYKSLSFRLFVRSCSVGLIIGFTAMPPTKRAYTRRNGKSPYPQSIPPMRHMRGVIGKACHYREEISVNIQEKIKEVEEDAYVSRGCLSDSEIREEFQALIPDPGNTRGHATLYQRTLNNHWMLKSVLGKTLVDKGEAQAEVLLQQDEMTLMLKQILQNQKQIAHRLGVKLVEGTGLPANQTGLD